uniref:RNA-directed DNA polymerase, eukaryota, reverse transcriptase zinc-binding domain protein n=1 Tax=Tanacetum cinerariifolium TaxID=118510 RepID=A0A699QV08_TANCI|nr:RNA-directed DNA polymerase, eukaryota, reverse transcriptase zinc-binding domain protein [Tanacetum cinerariifolium]
MKLTHLSFADDLLVLCGDVESVNLIKQALMKFSNSSGLKPNIDKSVVFFGSVKEATKIKIIETMHFKVGNLPVKYLGIPLLAKKLAFLSTMQTYWASVLLIPKTVVKEIGGFGLKQLGDWNEVLLCKLIWKIVRKKEDLWVKWANLVKLKGKSF